LEIKLNKLWGKDYACKQSSTKGLWNHVKSISGWPYCLFLKAMLFFGPLPFFCGCLFCLFFTIFAFRGKKSIKIFPAGQKKYKIFPAGQKSIKIL
jgi:hypothetical protein